MLPTIQFNAQPQCQTLDKKTSAKICVDYKCQVRVFRCVHNSSCVRCVSSVLLMTLSSWQDDPVGWPPGFISLKLNQVESPWDAPIACLSATCPLYSSAEDHVAAFLINRQLQATGQITTWVGRTGQCLFLEVNKQHCDERTLILLQPIPSLSSPLAASGVSCCARENAAETSKKTVFV